MGSLVSKAKPSLGDSSEAGGGSGVRVACLWAQFFSLPIASPPNAAPTVTQLGAWRSLDGGHLDQVCGACPYPRGWGQRL